MSVEGRRGRRKLASDCFC
ncbi:hypothetical protein Zm00014a_043940 [Zea mays]|uniref:Uncharacterized protein n=1 Tax=Zea mays TaxID=4577 RepID=A0A3L6FN55_MAIZE|nr:hypothetical protein Zm00014a_043940 [Zea mays]